MQRDGRAAYFRIVAIAEGDAANNKRLHLANRVISQDPHNGGLFYTNEASFSFSAYSTKLHQAYVTVGRLQNDPGDQAKVIRLVGGMNVPNSVEITIAKSHVMDNFLADWPGAVNYLSTKVAQAFPTSMKKRKPAGPGRRVSEAKRGRGGGRRGRGGRGGGRGGARGAMFNGVDCTDFKKNFSGAEMKQMGDEGFRYIKRKRDEAKAKAKAQERGGGGGRSQYGRGGNGGRGGGYRAAFKVDASDGYNESAYTEEVRSGGDRGDGADNDDDYGGSHRSAKGRGGRAGAGFGRGAYGRGGRGG